MLRSDLWRAAHQNLTDDTDQWHGNTAAVVRLVRPAGTGSSSGSLVRNCALRTCWLQELEVQKKRNFAAQRSETLTAFWRSVDHVEFVYLFGIVLCLGVVLTATLLSIPPELLQQLLGAVVQRLDLIRDFTRSEGVWRTRQPQFAQNLPSYGLDPLPLHMVDIHGGTSGQRWAQRCAVEEEDEQ